MDLNAAEFKRIVDSLRKATFVTVRLGPTTTAAAPRAVP